MEEVVPQRLFIIGPSGPFMVLCVVPNAAPLLSEPDPLHGEEEGSRHCPHGIYGD